MILKFILCLLLLVLPTSGWAAIAYVSHTEAAIVIGTASITVPVTVSAGTDRVMLVCSQTRHTSAAKAITGITFNGTEAFTGIRADTRTDSFSNGYRTELWYLVAPTVTTANLVVTYSASNARGTVVSATQLTGASQTSPVDSSAGSNGTGATASAVITTVADNAAIIDCVHGKHAAGLTVGAGQTMRSDRIVGGGWDDGVGVSTVVGKTPAGAETMDWTQSADDWVISTASITPSGGSDPPPVIPTQVTLAWTNGTDPGSPSTGVVSTTALRCTGEGCNATIAPSIGTVAYPIAGYTDTTVAIGNTYGYSAFHTDGVGRTSTRHPTVYVTTSSTPPATLPTIVSALTTLVGSTLVYGSTPPTQIRVDTFTSAQVISSVIHELTDFPGGVFTQTWPAGLQGVCFVPIDADGIPNNAGTQCDNLQVLGVGPIDLEPPALSCPATVNIPADVTEWEFSCLVDKVATGKYHTSDVDYDDMPNDMALSSLTFSATKTGLTNGSSTPLYLRAQSTDILGDLHQSTTSTVVTLVVAGAAGDITPPGNVANLACTLLGNAVSCTHDAAADAVSYQVYQSDGACIVYSVAANPAAALFTLTDLPFNTVFCWKVKAVDVVGNLSASFSNIVTKTTGNPPPVFETPDLTTIHVTMFTAAALIEWPYNGGVPVQLESCLVAVGQLDCVNFTALSTPAAGSYLTPNVLLAGRRYCFRGRNTDAYGEVSGNYSGVVCAATPDVGFVNSPRLENATGTRGTSTRLGAGTRLDKP